MTDRAVIRDAETGGWLIFEEPVETIEAQKIEEVLPCLARLETLTQQSGLFAAGWISYEAAPAFDAALGVRPADAFPFVRFGVYRGRRVVAELPLAEGRIPAGPWTASISREEYQRAVDDVKQCIARGETYQVNYTFRLRRQFAGDAWPLFLALVRAQPARYAAWVDTPSLAVCSASPELFFRLQGEELTACPMKGTAPRGPSHAADRATAEALHRSTKDRAENAMIVDMMRNDIGRVARFGSIGVSRLFQVERLPTLWQMTSTVTARTAAPITDILRAMFPSASVTGAPKASTMRIIARLETAPRRIYTGAIGIIGPGRRAEFNVAIRTLLVDKLRGEAEYGVGSGVVWDSTSAGEYDECLVKTHVLVRPSAEFSLLETLGWRPGEGYFLLDEHLRRLAESAEYFDFSCNLARVRDALMRVAAGLPPASHRVRLVVSRGGGAACEASVLPAGDAAEPVRLELAKRAVDSSNPLLYHKTTERAVYDMARKDCPEADDVLLHNERGEITETCIANVVLRRGDALVTPPVRSGLLPGVFREWLLRQGKIREEVVPLAALDACDEMFVVNSVRQWRRAVLRSIRRG